MKFRIPRHRREKQQRSASQTARKRLGQSKSGGQRPADRQQDRQVRGESRLEFLRDPLLGDVPLRVPLHPPSEPTEAVGFVLGGSSGKSAQQPIARWLQSRLQQTRLQLRGSHHEYQVDEWKVHGYYLLGALEAGWGVFRNYFYE